MASPGSQEDIAAMVKQTRGELNDYVKEKHLLQFIVRMCFLVEVQEIYLKIVDRTKESAKELPEDKVLGMLQDITQTSLQQWKSLIDEKMKFLRALEKESGENPISSRYPWSDDCIKSSWTYLWDPDIAQKLHAMNVHTEKRVKKLDKIVFRTSDEDPEQEQAGPSGGHREASPVLQCMQNGQWVTYLPETIEVKWDDLKTIDPTGLFFQDVLKEDSPGVAVEEHLERTMQIITGKAPEEAKPEPQVEQKVDETSEVSTPEDSGVESLKSKESGAKIKTRSGSRNRKTTDTTQMSTSGATATSGPIVTKGKRLERSPKTSPTKGEENRNKRQK